MRAALGLLVWPVSAGQWARPGRQSVEVRSMRGVIVFVIILLLGGGIWAALVGGCVAS